MENPRVTVFFDELVPEPVFFREYARNGFSGECPADPGMDVSAQTMISIVSELARVGAVN